LSGLFFRNAKKRDPYGEVHTFQKCPLQLKDFNEDGVQKSWQHDYMGFGFCVCWVEKMGNLLGYPEEKNGNICECDYMGIFPEPETGFHNK
jgi:hypothetical protein